MKVKELIELLNNFNPNSEIYSQTVAEDGSAWNMSLEVKKLNPTTVILTLSHPQLKSLRAVEKILNLK